MCKREKRQASCLGKSNTTHNYLLCVVFEHTNKYPKILYLDLVIDFGCKVARFHKNTLFVCQIMHS